MLTPENYPEIRQQIADIVDRIIKSMPPRDSIKICARRLGIWKNKALVFNAESELSLLFDYRIFAYRPHGITEAEKYYRIHHHRLPPDEQALLSNIANARYRIFSIDNILTNDSLDATDIIRKERFKLIDTQLPKSAKPGLVLAGHIISFGEYSVQTGSLLLIDSILLNCEEIDRLFSRFVSLPDGSYDLKPLVEEKLASIIIKRSIDAGYTQKVHYHEV